MADPLVDELAARPELFARETDGALRHWFTRRSLAYLRAGPAPADERADLLAALGLARTLAAEVGVALAAEPDPELRRFTLSQLAVRAAYGALGVHPKALLREDRADYLLFIVKRRIFAVDRCRANVNDGSEFTYPEAGDLLRQHPNAPALPSWVGVTVAPLGGVNRYPFVLTAAGLANPDQAVTTMFTAGAQPEGDENVFDCAGAAMTVHTDALVEAAVAPATLAAALAAEGPRYLAIDHPFGSAAVVDNTLVQGATPITVAAAAAGDHVDVPVAFAWTTPPPPATMMLIGPTQEEQVVVESVGWANGQYTGTIRIAHLGADYPAGSRLVPPGRPAFHLITDPRPDTALFEQVFVPDDEIQIGDHVYLASHPIHRNILSVLAPTPWGGEHAFVCDAPVTRRDTMLISGHGVSEQPLRHAVDTKLLVDSNALIDILRNVLRRQLTTPAAPVWTGPFADLSLAADLGARLRDRYGEPDDAPIVGTCKVYEYPGVEFDRADSVERLMSKPFQTMTFEGTVGAAALDAHTFVLYRGVELGHSPTDWSSPPYLPLERSETVNAGRPELERFGFYYRDDTRAFTEVFLPLFHTDADRRSGVRRLTYDDITQQLYGGPTGTAFVTRPRVVDDPTGSYVASLRQKGALPATP
ncbi:hypothetical protein DFJ67_5995 [Asanoa ferruginea]|uniref:Uncharacterized protein n=1 Tax=Asanoa ferruginea TaxID=53367 RepID=A0A3D9ZRC3_9ACTN|nr:hypothetical protein [Asanoa ferruginea]REF99948.1 hypothetical protein DFJ67_5995 [Asanoa ferruginea]GIF53168.1 hypothetical protein Afe04nite_77070 [Asanoa ferruginea]